MFNRAPSPEQVLVGALADAIRAIVRDELAQAAPKQATPRLSLVKAPVFDIGMPVNPAKAKKPGGYRRGDNKGNARGAHANHDNIANRQFDHDECCELFLAGVEIPDIAEHFDVTYMAVRMVLQRRGHIQRNYRCGPEVKAQIISMRRDGKTVREIAKEVGMSYSAPVGIIKDAVRDGVLPANCRRAK